MHDFIIKDEDGILTLNIPRLITLARGIVEKYEINTIPFLRNNEKLQRESYRRINEYFFHIFEEVMEWRDTIPYKDQMDHASPQETYVHKRAIEDHNTVFLEEAIDVLLYTLSAYYFIIKLVNTDALTQPIMEEDSKFPSSLSDKIFMLSEQDFVRKVRGKKESFLYGRCVNDMLESIYKLRRVFPQRKWHKPFKPEVPIKYLELCKPWFNRIFEAFLDAVSEFPVERIEKVIKEKSGFIYDLEKVI